MTEWAKASLWWLCGLKHLGGAKCSAHDPEVMASNPGSGRPWVCVVLLSWISTKNIQDLFARWAGVRGRKCSARDSEIVGLILGWGELRARHIACLCELDLSRKCILIPNWSFQVELVQEQKTAKNRFLFWFKYDLDRHTLHPKFDPTWICTLYPWIPDQSQYISCPWDAHLNHWPITGTTCLSFKLLTVH